MKSHHDKILMTGALALFSSATVLAQGYYPTPPASTPSTGSANRYSYKTSQGQYGEYLADYQGKAVYAYGADTAGSGQSNCYEQCAVAWPPVTVPNGQSPSASGNVKQEYLGTIQRTDGTYQVTYYGYPVYYYAADQSPSDYKGYKVNDYGAVWYLLTPDGKYVP